METRRDPLTSLLNHQAFSQALVAEVERAARYEAGLTLVLFDIDRFKDVNETLGHIEGDRVLRCVAEVASATLRASDLAGRLGGDEFAVLLLHTDKHCGDRFLQRLRSGLPEDLSVTAGCAHFPTEAGSAEGLLHLADQRSTSVECLEKVS